MNMRFKRGLAIATLAGSLSSGFSCYVPCNERAFHFEKRTRLEQQFENRDKMANALVDALSVDCTQIRKLAADALVKMRPVPILVARLRARDMATKEIISILGRIRDADAAFPIVETMEFCLSGSVACKPEDVLSALQSIGGPAVQNIAGFAKHENKTVRMGSIKILAKMREFEVLIPALTRALSKEETAAEAADEIRNILVRERMEPASGFLIHDWSTVVFGLCNALKKHRVKEDHFTNALAEMGTKAIPALASLLEEGDWWVRTRAAKAIEMGIGANPDADWKSLAPALSESWAKESDWTVKRYMAQPLKKIGRKAMPAFVEMLRKNSNSDEKFVFEAAEILGELGGKYAVVDLIKDGDAMVRKVAVLALKDVGDGTTIPLLLEKSWRDPDTDVKRFASYAMQKIGERERRGK
jgi:HEAT repeat protein